MKGVEVGDRYRARTLSTLETGMLCKLNGKGLCLVEGGREFNVCMCVSQYK